MATATQELTIIILLLMVNGMLAMSEIALVSANKIRLEKQRDKGDMNAAIALKLANNPNRVLSTVQIGITVIGIFAGAYSGATIAESLALLLGQVPMLDQHSDAIALFLVVLILTHLWLVIGELIPKRIALSYPEQTATLISPTLNYLSKWFSPVVYLLGLSSDFLLRLFHINLNTDEPLITQEEIKVMLKQGTEAGTFEAAEQDMVERVLQLGQRQVNTLMTPRPEIVWLDLEDSSESNRNKVVAATHSRFPVCQSSLDNVLGVIPVTSLLSSELQGKPFDLTNTLRQPLFIPESTKVLKALELLQQTGTNIAFIVDEYGIIQGLVTLNDVIESIIGDLPRLDQQCSLQIIQREDGSWLLDGVLAIADFKKRFSIQELPGEDRGNYHTLGGFIITHLGRIPNVTDHFEWQGLRFEVMGMDGNRVDKILVIPLGK